MLKIFFSKTDISNVMIDIKAETIQSRYIRIFRLIEISSFCDKFLIEISIIFSNISFIFFS